MSIFKEAGTGLFSLFDKVDSLNVNQNKSVVRAQIVTTPEEYTGPPHEFATPADQLENNTYPGRTGWQCKVRILDPNMPHEKLIDTWGDDGNSDDPAKNILLESFLSTMIMPADSMGNSPCEGLQKKDIVFVRLRPGDNNMTYSFQYCDLESVEIRFNSEPSCNQTCHDDLAAKFERHAETDIWLNTATSKEDLDLDDGYLRIHFTNIELHQKHIDFLDILRRSIPVPNEEELTHITITSGYRGPDRQAKAMYDNRKREGCTKAWTTQRPATWEETYYDGWTQTRAPTKIVKSEVQDVDLDTGEPMVDEDGEAIMTEIETSVPNRPTGDDRIKEIKAHRKDSSNALAPTEPKTVYKKKGRYVKTAKGAKDQYIADHGALIDPCWRTWRLYQSSNTKIEEVLAVDNDPKLIQAVLAAQVAKKQLISNHMHPEAAGVGALDVRPTHQDKDWKIKMNRAQFKYLKDVLLTLGATINEEGNHRHLSFGKTRGLPEGTASTNEQFPWIGTGHPDPLADPYVVDLGQVYIGAEDPLLSAAWEYLQEIESNTVSTLDPGDTGDTGYSDETWAWTRSSKW